MPYFGVLRATARREDARERVRGVHVVVGGRAALRDPARGACSGAPITALTGC